MALPQQSTAVWRRQAGMAALSAASFADAAAAAACHRLAPLLLAAAGSGHVALPLPLVLHDEALQRFVPWRQQHAAAATTAVALC
jgi:hypothetical protein